MNYVEPVSLVTIIIYVLASIFGFAGMIRSNGFWSKLGCHFALGAFFVQTLAMIAGFHKSAGAFLSTGAWLQLIAWFILLCGSAAWWRLRTDSLLLFAAPFGLALFIMSMPWLGEPLTLPGHLSSTFYILHTGAIFLSIGLFSIAFIAGVLFLAMEKRLKKRKALRGFWQDMPHLELLDKVNAVCVLAGFPLYTIGLITGFFWAGSIYGKTISGDLKEYFSLLIWLLLAVVFHNRLAHGWKGRKPALLLIVIFALSIVSLLILNFLFPGHHSFIRA